MQLQTSSAIAPIDDWQMYSLHGSQFLNTATQAWEKQKRSFSYEALYNLVAMSIEKFIMAFLMRYGDLAENHTMPDLITALEKHVGRQPELRKKLEFMGKFQEICEMDSYTVIKPTKSDIKKILMIGQEVKFLLHPLLEESC